MAVHKVREGILLCKAETTEGTWNDPVAETNAVRLYDVTYSTEPRLYDRRPYKSGFSTLPALKGGTVGVISFKIELAGSGTSATTTPYWSPLLIACGWQTQAMERITLSGAPTGTFIPGEVITQGTSNATAVFVKYISSGGHFLEVCTISGTEDDSHVWTGAISSAEATATSTGAASTYGVLHRPSTSSASYSVALYEPFSSTECTAFQLKGCRGTWKIGASAVGEPIFVECEIRGVVNDVAHEQSTPSARYQNFTSIPFKGSDFFSMAQNSSTGMAAEFIKIHSFSVDGGVELAMRDSANDNGYISAMITGRNTKGNFDPELVEYVTDPSTDGHDIWNDYDADVQSVLSCSLGSSAGNYIDIYCGNVRYQGYSGADRDGIRTLDMPFGIHENGDAEDHDVLLLTR